MNINETYKVEPGYFMSQGGKRYDVAYIASDKAEEDAYNVRNVIKKHGGNWIGAIKKWGWFIGSQSDAQDKYSKYIQPCLSELNADNDEADLSPESVKTQIDQLINAINGSGAELTVRQNNKSYTADEIKRKLEDFKNKLVNTMSADEFKEMMRPIINAHRAMGRGYSFTNTLLIWLQDPDAKLVKSRTGWKRYNRTVKEGAPAICLWVPQGDPKANAEKKKQIRQSYLDKYGVANVKDLAPDVQERLDVELKRNEATSFKLAPYFFDKRFTEQIPGTEDLIGSSEDESWHEDLNAEGNEELMVYVDAMRNAIKAQGITLSDKENLGGALGVSKSGSIETLKGAKENVALLNTLIHEYSHEILHQKWLTNHNNDLKDYFVGTKDGRAKVEQQAEISAWIVLQFLGIECPSSLVYVSGWGLDEKTAGAVFDTVANTAAEIYRQLYNEVSKIDRVEMNEWKDIAPKLITGRQLAALCGMEQLYDRSKEYEEEQEDQQAINSLQETFRHITNFKLL